MKKQNSIMNNFNFKWGTHKQILYDYLNAGNTITTRDAMIDLGIADLQGVIRNLKEAGVHIQTTDKKVPTRYSKRDGSTKYSHIKEYALSKVGCNIDTYNLKTDEEQKDWQEFLKTPMPQKGIEDIKNRHKETHSGTCSSLGVDTGTVSTLREKIKRTR
jgi:hypothetical protein